MHTREWFLALLLITSSSSVNADPEVSHLYPDFAGHHLGSSTPHIITGEGFDTPGLKVLAFSPPSDEKTVLDALARLGEAGIRLPAVPPQMAQEIQPLDVERQIITVRLGQNSALWIRNAEGVSAPYLFNVAQPFWISHATASPGAVLYIFGFGLRMSDLKTRLALRSSTGDTITLEPGLDPRLGYYVADDKLLYFRLPDDLKLGDYTVWVHNGLGGEYGWRSPGRIAVAVAKNTEKLFDVRRFGAVGDGLANDTAALVKAMAAAGEAGGVVFLPPGTYKVDESLRVPAGVTLRGAGRENTSIEGFGYDPSIGRQAWYTRDKIPASVVLLTNDTGLKSLSVKGVLSRGAGGIGLVEIVPSLQRREVQCVSIIDCNLESRGVHPEYGTTLYRDETAVYADVPLIRLRLAGNVIRGSAGNNSNSLTTRSEICDNTFHGGGVFFRAVETLLDANLFTDSPSRILFYPQRNCYARLNETHNYVRRSWKNFPEAILVHGSGTKTISSPTNTAPTSLTDSRRNWTPGQYADATVLITAGRGFGQYRRVVNNTVDTLTVHTPWRVLPDKTSEYAVGSFFVDNAYSANLNTGPGWFSLWLDCIGNVVEKHRDAFAGGINVWGRDISRVETEGKVSGEGLLCPSWYNLLCNNWLDGSTVELVSGDRPENAYRGPTLFANYVVQNKVRQPHMKRIPLDYQSHNALGGIALLKLWPAWGVPAVEERNKIKERDSRYPEAGRAGVAHSIIADNFVSFTHAGIVIHNHARKTFVLNNEFQEVEHPILNWGHQTLIQGNSILRLDSTGESRVVLPNKQ